MTVAAALESVPILGICRVVQISPSDRRLEVHKLLLSIDRVAPKILACTRLARATNTGDVT